MHWLAELGMVSGTWQVLICASSYLTISKLNDVQIVRPPNDRFGHSGRVCGVCLRKVGDLLDQAIDQVSLDER